MSERQRQYDADPGYRRHRSQRNHSRILVGARLRKGGIDKGRPACEIDHLCRFHINGVDRLGLVGRRGLEDFHGLKQAIRARRL